MNVVVEWLMKRDGITEEEAREMIVETREEMLEDPYVATEILEDNLGIEPDYIMDILDL